MIQCIIAQLTLNDDFEFGIEFGLQNDALFGRGDLASNPLNPGFNFNTTSPLPNSTNFRPAQVANQALGNFSLGRASLMDGLGAAGGMILTASSQNISAMLRAIQGNRQLEIVARPQIMTMDGRTARVFVGENFPYLGAINTQNLGSVTQQVDYQPIGTSLTVKPSITPDDRIYLEIVPEVTELREIVEFSTLTTSQQAPRTSVTAANTVVSVNSGQTIVLAGLIQKRHTDFVRKIPWLGDLPCVGFLFRYTQERDQKQELLIFMTPHIVRNEDDAQRIKNVEIGRMNWILNHTPDLHGDLGLTEGEDNAMPLSEASATGEPTVINPNGQEAYQTGNNGASGRQSLPIIRLMNLEPVTHESDSVTTIEHQSSTNAADSATTSVHADSGSAEPSNPAEQQQTKTPERKSLRHRVRGIFKK
jgi:type II secretory pathway component GspD/PulD (secretin)